MSVVFETSEGFIVCHNSYLENLYISVHKEDIIVKLIPQKKLFLVKTPYMKDGQAAEKVKDVPTHRSSRSSKRQFCNLSANAVIETKVSSIKNIYEQLLDVAQRDGHFAFSPSPYDFSQNNKDARSIAEKLYKDSTCWIVPPFSGENNTDEALVKKVGSEYFVFPPYCKFFCQDVQDIGKYEESLGKFDMILLDPPWWNKYIRRKKAKCLREGYKMMYNDTIGELPLEKLLAPGGIIAVWCTNSKNNLEELREKLFPSWGAKQIAQWTWLKVTQSGHLICPFSEPPGKQPFEQLVFGVRPEDVSSLPRPQNGKVFLSVPSAIHSHKPPISEIMQPYLPAEPRCLEIFARYLLPNWTSWGLEVIKLQHLSLFSEDQISSS